jgi:hypothetical protein
LILNFLKLPALQDPNLQLDPSENGFANNSAFTHASFPNWSHCNDNTSKTVFLMLCNVQKDTWFISLDSHHDPPFSGHLFVFTDHQVVVDLFNLNGVRMVFDTMNFEHCMHKNQSAHPHLTPFGFSLHIMKSCVDAFKRLCKRCCFARFGEKGVGY